MLSIAVIGSAGAAHSYYESDNYYAKGDKEHSSASTWHGRGAEALGLTGAVDANAFENILDGQVPAIHNRDGPLLGRIVDGKRQHVAGIDLTFSAPKSVSILAEGLEDKNLRSAHGKAVTATLDWAERHVLNARRFNPVTGQQDVIAGQKMVAALFRHDTSRNLDPQLHTHAVIANMVEGEDGKWRSLHNPSLYEHKMLLGAMYRSELAANLAGLGYAIERTHRDGRFELKNFPDTLIQAFSTRSHDINASLEGLDHQSPEIRSKAALMTRKPKRDVDRSELRGDWRERAQEAGFDLAELRDSLASSQKQFRSRMTPEQVVEDAISHLSERNSTFPHQELMRSAIAYGTGYVRTGEIEATINEQAEDGRLITSGRTEHANLLTTPEAASTERETIQLMRAGYAAVDPLMPEKKIEKRMDAKLANNPLNEGQRDAVRHILGSVNRTIGVQGYAGTGKTTMLGTARDLARRSGYHMLGLAPSASAAKTLGTEAGMPSMTLQKFLAKYDGVAHGRLTEAGRRQLSRQYRNTLLVLDESSLASTTQMRDLLVVAETLRFPRLVLVGDRQQLDAVDAGTPFAQLQSAGMATVTMSDIFRQRSGRHREAVFDTIRGDIRAAFANLREDVVEIGEGSLASEAAVRYLDQPPHLRSTSAVIAPTHALRKAINQEIREGLKKEGRIGDKSRTLETWTPLHLTGAEKAHAESYEAGQRVHFNRDYRSLGVRKGQSFEVQAVDAGEGLVALTNSRQEITWSPARVAGQTKGAVEVFDVNQTEFSPGDAIRWTRNDEQGRFLNSETGTVRAIHQRGLWIESTGIEGKGNKRQFVRASDPQLRHMEHGWANTIHAFQGRTVDHVIAVMESRNALLTDQKSFYVTVSRARDGMTLITDDRERLQNTLEAHTGERLTALDLVEPEKAKETEQDIQTTRDQESAAKDFDMEMSL